MKVRNIKSNPDYNYFNVEVSYDDESRVLTASANSFRIASMDYELEEDERYEVPIREEHTYINGHLVELEDGTCRILFDEVSEIDPPFSFADSEMKNMGVFIKIETQGDDIPMIEVFHLVDTSEEETAEAAIVEFYKKVGLLGKDL